MHQAHFCGIPADPSAAPTPAAVWSAYKSVLFASESYLVNSHIYFPVITAVRLVGIPRGKPKNGIIGGLIHKTLNAGNCAHAMRTNNHFWQPTEQTDNCPY